MLFDIAKFSLSSKGDTFAGYSKETIGRIINDIINQQDNDTLLNTLPDKQPEVKRDEPVNKLSTVLDNFLDDF